MKKMTGLYIVVICCFLSAVLLFVNRDKQMAGNSTAIISGSDKGSIEEVYEKCPVVVVGEIIDEGSVVDGVQVMTVKTIDRIKGDADDEFLQFHEYPLEVGERYLLFLEKTELTAYPSARYITYYDDSFLKISDGKLKAEAVGSDWYLRQLPEDTDEAVEYLKSLPVTYSDTEEYSIPENFELTEENIKNCDCVFTMKPTEVYSSNGFTDEVIFNVTVNYKGTMTDLKQTLPKRIGFEKDKEYLLFMTNFSGEFTQLAAYNGAVICEDDENYSEALELVKSIFGEQN